MPAAAAAETSNIRKAVVLLWFCPHHNNIQFACIYQKPHIWMSEREVNEVVCCATHIHLSVLSCCGTTTSGKKIPNKSATVLDGEVYLECLLSSGKVICRIALLLLSIGYGFMDTNIHHMKCISI